MKTASAILVALLFASQTILYAQGPRSQTFFNPNNISTFFVTSGIFNINDTLVNTPGFQWPAGSNKYAIFSSGLNITAYVNGSLRMAAASFHGEYTPGYILNYVPAWNSDFKIYKVTRGDGPSNPDWANWYKMIPYGAPYFDVNNNGTFEQGIDTPGVHKAKQTIFLCMTDGFTSTHTQSEGFSGGTAPLNAEVHMTAWGYNNSMYSDLQFIKYDIINKGSYNWDSTYMGIFCDPDLGNALDDYIGCDTSRQLAYTYNKTNMDGSGNPPSYGANPPAVGIILLKGCRNEFVNPPVNLRMTTFHQLFCWGCSAPVCELMPIYPFESHRMLKGYKRDGSNFMNPLTVPPTPTKFTYTGDPETATGWTEAKGSVLNCGGDTGTVINVNPSADPRFLIGSGADNFKILPGDTQKIVICQLIARGNSNLNSVTKLKQLSDVAWNLYNSGFVIKISSLTTEVPGIYSLSQNYPNPFNPVTKIKFSVPRNNIVCIKVFNMLGKEVAAIINDRLQPGIYEAEFDGSTLPSGVYFYRLTSGDFSETKKMVLLK